MRLTYLSYENLYIGNNYIEEKQINWFLEKMQPAKGLMCYMLKFQLKCNGSDTL